MTYDTLNDAVTMAGGEGTLIANRYRIVRQLGQGGMGSVWLAEDTQLDNKPFAIKMLPSILVSNKRAYRQLKDEALVAMNLVHPNIVQIRAFEENNGNPFLVMDYIDGQTLDDYLAEKGKLSEDETIKLLKPIAAALDYAHSKGVVHRDVKPGNVMIAKDGTPFILDFGIAREMQETMTRVTGKLSSGTLLYMSPEQLHGAVPKSAQDIYSFAAMVYECLSGAPPFTRGQIAHQIEHDTPAPLQDGFSIAKMVMSGLAKKPEDRPEICGAIFDLSGAEMPSPAIPPRTFAEMVASSRGRVQSRKSRVYLVLWGVVACILVVVGFCCWRYWENVQTEKEDRKRQAEIQAEQSAKAERDRRNAENKRREEEIARRQAEEKQKAEEAAEKRRRESAELDSIKEKIADKVGVAEGNVHEAEKYRGDPVGFENHLASLDAAAMKLKNIPAPKTVAEANDILKSVNVVAGTISSELDWLSKNMPRRESARQIEKDIKSGLDAELIRFEVSASVADSYAHGQALRRDGNAALEKGDFALARKKLAEAKAKLTKALSEAKAIREKQLAEAEAARIAAEKAEAAAIPSSGARSVYVSGRSSVRFTEEDADTLCMLKFSSSAVRAYYEMACKLAMEGAYNKTKVKAEYNTGRMCGGPRWPELEAWLDWWK